MSRTLNLRRKREGLSDALRGKRCELWMIISRNNYLLTSSPVGKLWADLT